jgi:hypothetical protein
MMRQDDHQHAHFEGEQTNGGGAAPEHRRCQYIKADGKGCRDWAVRGQELCYRHGVFLRGGRGIDVPLLEDESSIVLVLSDTLRAVALRAMPANDGRLLLDGCRLAHTMHMDRLAAARLERREKRDREEEMVKEQQETEAEPCALSSEPCEEPREECGARCPEPCALSSEPCKETPATPVLQPPSSRHPRFRDTEKNWEEAQGEVLAAVAAPLDQLMEEETLAVGVR